MKNAIGEFEEWTGKKKPKTDAEVADYYKWLTDWLSSQKGVDTQGLFQDWNGGRQPWTQERQNQYYQWFFNLFTTGSGGR
jgi:hypothetical protein